MTTEINPGTIIRWKDIDYRVLVVVDERLQVEYTALSGKTKDAWWSREWFRFIVTSAGVQAMLRYKRV